MVDTGFDLNEHTLSFVENIGRHMPGGFFIYKATRLAYRFSAATIWTISKS